MAVKWISSRFPGVRYYEHASRKHGVKFDRYFAIRAQVNGKRREEGLGWSSEGWSEQRAATVLADLKKAQATGEGPQTLAERRAEAEAKREAKQAEQARLEREGVTFAAVFNGAYLEHARGNKKPNSVRTEETLFIHWISPSIGHIPLKDVAPLH